MTVSHKDIINPKNVNAERQQWVSHALYLIINSLTFSEDCDKSNVQKSTLFPWERLSLSWGQGKVKNMATAFERASWKKPQKRLKRVWVKTLENPNWMLTYRGHGSRLRSFVLHFIVCLKCDLLQLFVVKTNHLTYLSFKTALKNALSSSLTYSQLKELLEVNLINSLDQYYNSCRKSQDHKICILHPLHPDKAILQLFGSHLSRLTLWEKSLWHWSLVFFTWF